MLFRVVARARALLSKTPSMRLAVVPARAREVEHIWRDLEAAYRPSYFQTWGWIENWLAMLPADEQPELAIVHSGGAPIAAFFVGRRRVLRHHFVPSKGAFVNATGIERYDELCVEHNAPLGAPLSLADLVTLMPRDWDELFVERASLAFAAGEMPHGFRKRIDRTASAPFVDLQRVRQGGYLPLLSGNTRSQIRRAQRRIGDVAVEVAETYDQARDIYAELVALHTQSWRDRGEPGAFADEWFDAFHRRLIDRRFSAGEIQLVRMREHGGRTVGCLYNFVANGRVLFYQSGLAHYDDPQIKPGYLLHTAAIEHDAAAGHHVYDFLGGNGRYKASLATDEVKLVWARVQRTHLRFALEDRVRRLRDALVSA